MGKPTIFTTKTAILITFMCTKPKLKAKSHKVLKKLKLKKSIQQQFINENKVVSLIKGNF